MITACRNQPLAGRSARALAGCLAFSIFVTAPRTTFAQLAIAQAQSLFDQGRDLIKAGKIAEACAAFASSYKLDPVVTTLLNLADCRAKDGQLASAWGHFIEAQRLARAAGDEKLLRVATKHADRLKPRLSKLTLTVSRENVVPGLVLMRGDEIIDPATWNNPLPVDGGDYVLTAKAPGKRPWMTDITIKAERDIWVLDVPRLLGTDESPVPEKASAVATAAARTPVTSATSGTAAPSPRAPAASRADTTLPSVAVSSSTKPAQVSSAATPAPETSRFMRPVVVPNDVEGSVAPPTAAKCSQVERAYTEILTLWRKDPKLALRLTKIALKNACFSSDHKSRLLSKAMEETGRVR